MAGSTGFSPSSQGKVSLYRFPVFLDRVHYPVMKSFHSVGQWPALLMGQIKTVLCLQLQIERDHQLAVADLPLREAGVGKAYPGHFYSRAQGQR